MPCKSGKIYQSFNKKSDSWVKFTFGEGGFIPLDVKQRNPSVPFKNVRIYRRK